MKKDRNTFFEGSSMNMAAFNTGMPSMPMPMNMQQPIMPMNAQASASQSFYSNTMPMTPNFGSTAYNDSTISELESRMAKLERTINRLENRLNKLEGSTYYNNDTYESNNGMYMV